MPGLFKEEKGASYQSTEGDGLLFTDSQSPKFPSFRLRRKLHLRSHHKLLAASMIGVMAMALIFNMAYVYRHWRPSEESAGELNKGPLEASSFSLDQAVEKPSKEVSPGIVFPVSVSAVEKPKKEKEEIHEEKPKKKQEDIQKAVDTSSDTDTDTGDGHEDEDDQSICKSENFTSNTLKAAFDVPMAALLQSTWDTTKFEASGVIKVGNKLYAVDDDSFSLGEFLFPMTFSEAHNTLIPRNPQNHLDDTFVENGGAKDTDASAAPSTSGPADASKPPSGSAAPGSEEHSEGGYEGITWDPHSGIFYLMVEAIPNQNDGNVFHGVVVEVVISPTGKNYQRIAECPTNFNFSDSNKGFEGVIFFTNNERMYLLGLCEGNYCMGGDKGRDPGHGKIVLFEKKTGLVDRTKAVHRNCMWEYMYTIDIPKEANFRDYSDLAMNENGRVLITSQEDSRLWVGELDYSNIRKLHLHSGKVYDFPRDNECRQIYCNIEGVDWVTNHLIVATSDQMKSGGRQHYRCLGKDQSMHLFVIPTEYEK